MTAHTRTFYGSVDFQACRPAQRFLAERGFSVGSMKGPSPRGILYGEYDIQKWRNLSAEERRELHGIMAGSMRNGPITITLYDSAPEEAKAEFERAMA